MPASLRVIKIVKDTMGAEAYTVELEIESEEAKNLVKELIGCPYGQRFIELLNRAEFLPIEENKTAEEIKAEAEAEEAEISRRENELQERGKKEGMRLFLKNLKEFYGEDFAKEYEIKLKEKQKKEDESHITSLAGDAN